MAADRNKELDDRAAPRPSAGTVMVCLVGEQPIPNLLPIRHCKPAQVILIETPTTKRIGDNLKRLLQPAFEIYSHPCPPYEIVAAQDALRDLLLRRVPKDPLLLFNVTGGTKPMCLATFQVASELRAPVVYLQSEGGENVLYRYSFQDDKLVLEKKEIIGELLNIDDYLRAHGLAYSRQETKNLFERFVFDALRPHVSEIVSGVAVDTLEIDLVIRCQNQVGVAEVKSGKASQRKSGIDQLSTASQREFLGTYTKRLLIVDRNPGTNNQRLADAHGIRVIRLSGDHRTGLSAEETDHLVRVAREVIARS
jgi:hypothetical protein